MKRRFWNRWRDYTEIFDRTVFSKVFFELGRTICFFILWPNHMKPLVLVIFGAVNNFFLEKKPVVKMPTFNTNL